ncbi:MAG: ABC transporter permease [Spirochaetia bacterium]
MLSKNNVKPSFGSYLQQCNMFQAVLISGLLFGLIMSFIFIREFTEDTLKSLLAIPVLRVMTILSKLGAGFFCVIGLSLASFAFQVLFAGVQKLCTNYSLHHTYCVNKHNNSPIKIYGSISLDCYTAAYR